MSQLTWTVLDDFGQKYDVGLYHGSTSGHVMVYCNKRVIIIDFNVLANKKYSFYLGEELCELNIKKQSDQFTYGLIRNNEANTPLNQRRKELNRQFTQKTILVAIFLVLATVSTYFIIVGCS